MGRELFLLVYAYGHLAVTRIENKHRMVSRPFLFPKTNRDERQLFTQPYYVYHANDSNEHGRFFMSSTGD